MAILILPNGTTQDVQSKGKMFTLTELQRLIGGYVERIPLPNGDCLVVDEDGLPRQLPVNLRATRLARLPGVVLVGPVLVLTNKEQHGVF